jgi:hypothetical protein
VGSIGPDQKGGKGSRGRTSALDESFGRVAGIRFEGPCVTTETGACPSSPIGRGNVPGGGGGGG